MLEGLTEMTLLNEDILREGAVFGEHEVPGVTQFVPLLGDLDGELLSPRMSAVLGLMQRCTCGREQQEEQEPPLHESTSML
jgi:hypothetical protein